MASARSPRDYQQRSVRRRHKDDSAQLALRVGTDCSGLDVPVAVLENIMGGRNRRIHHVFSSESDAKTRDILLHNFSPDFHYSDLARRPASLSASSSVASELPSSADLPRLDVYVAGFPCQAFSSAGLSAGVRDERGTLWVHIVRFISVALPRSVVLENVVGLTRGPHKGVFNAMMELLNSMGEYWWYHRILDTVEYGVPQSRPRVYIVGIRRSDAKAPFEWPAPAASPPQLDDFLDVERPITPTDVAEKLPPEGTRRRRMVMEVLEDLMSKGQNPLTTPAVYSVDNRHPTLMLNCSPCLTQSRTRGYGHWLVHRCRFMTTREMFKLQGLDPNRWACPGHVSDTHFRACLGNAMSGNVLKAVLLAVLEAIGEV